MGQQHWEKINNIVDTALELEKEERKRYINKECKDDPELKSEVTRLLESIQESEAEEFLEGKESYPQNLVSELSKTFEKSETSSSLVGQNIDNFKILEVVGHGGMGSVFLAERADKAYDQTVAIKVLRRGMDTPSNILRFKRERNILAKLEHPNISRLLDGGMTNEGLPYLVMEYVKGTPLITYCDTNNLTIEQRLDLFKLVCQAVQHAHNNAVIHRDLKPSNILVTEDGKVKILDFGIAKLLEPEEVSENLFQTRTGARMLTMGYAAPEQVEGEAVTTATDTYALGILLYKLLTGVHPFDLEKKNVTEIERLIRKKTPTKPSTKLGELPKSKQQQIAEQHNSTPSVLQNALKGDLDAIVMKALRKERKKRYNSTDQLLEDLRRRKQNLPIIAREDTIRYKTSKFIRRHKAGLSAAAGFALLIISFFAFYTWQITDERNQARRAAQKAEAVTSYLTDLLSRSNPYLEEKNVGLDVTLGSVLQYGHKTIDQEFENQPVVKAKVKTVIGQVYSQLGEFGKAESLLTEAYQIHKGLKSKAMIDQANTTKTLAFMYQDKGNYDRAETLLQETIQTLQTTKKGLITEEAASSIARLGNLSWFNKGQFKTADSLLTKALEIEQQIHSGNHLHIATRYNDLATMNHAQGKLSIADSYYRKAIANYRRLSGEHANLAIILSNFAILLKDRGDYKEAEQKQIEALKMHKEHSGENSIDIALGTGKLGQIYVEMGKYERADSLLHLSLEKLHKIYGESHPYIARNNLILGKLVRLKKNYQEAEEILSNAHAQFSKVYPENHPRISDPLLELGLLYLENDRLQQAGSYLEKTLDIRTSSYPNESWQMAEIQAAYGKYLVRSEEYKKAEKVLLNSYDSLVKFRGEQDPLTLKIQRNIASLYKEWNKPELAEKYR